MKVLVLLILILNSNCNNFANGQNANNLIRSLATNFNANSSAKDFLNNFKVKSQTDLDETDYIKLNLRLH